MELGPTPILIGALIAFIVSGIVYYFNRDYFRDDYEDPLKRLKEKLFQLKKENMRLRLQKSNSYCSINSTVIISSMIGGAVLGSYLDFIITSIIGALFEVYIGYRQGFN
jgi:hypothetical protein